MPAVVFYFHVHQPYRIKPYSLFSINDDHQYYNESNNDRLNNQKILHKVAQKCYLPMNNLLLKLLNQYDQFKVSFSISGILLDQLENYYPALIDSFKALVNTGKVELVNETYYHSLSYLYSTQEFKKQISLHRQKLKDLFGYTPTSFRNTELIYNNDLASIIESLGYKTILAEGVDRYLGWRSPNFVYRPNNTKKIRLLLKNYRLSDDIAFRFSNRGWPEWPLTAEKYAHWITSANGMGHIVNLFMDYETFGEHQWSDTGIFDFMERLPFEILKNSDNTFMTISQASSSYPVSDTIDMPEITSWADMERDISAWRSNPMQHAALQSVYDLESEVIDSHDDNLINDWRKLTTSDHFYYMCTKWFTDGDVHKYFSPNNTPYEAFVNYMNVLHDIRARAMLKNTKDTAHAHLYS